MLTFKRLLANLVDIAVFFAILTVCVLYLSPIALDIIGNTTVAAVTVFLLVATMVAGIQYPFMIIHQTIGKAFFRLKVISTNDLRPMTPSILLQRELFGKVATGYLLCLPSLFGKTGGHDAVAQTEVIST